MNTTQLNQDNDTQSFEQKTMTFLAQLLEQRRIRIPLTLHTELLSSGTLDSMDIIEIVVFLEDEFNIDFMLHVFDQENFQSPHTIIDFVQQCLVRNKLGFN
jgi:acyl carrier protein